MKYIFILIALISTQYVNAIIYRIHSHIHPVSYMNGHKYRESVGNKNSQIIFDSKKYPITSHFIDEYPEFILLDKYHEWNIVTTNLWIPLYSYNITELNVKEVIYSHNINYRGNGEIQLYVNNRLEYSKTSSSDLLHIDLPPDTKTIILGISNPNQDKIYLQSYRNKGFTHNANCWVWYKPSNEDSLEIMTHPFIKIPMEHDNRILDRILWSYHL